MVAIDAHEQMKARIRWMWSLGDYPELAALLQPGADALAEACRIVPGMDVLDVAAGTGNFAVTAAAQGARVTASDLTPRMVELGRARCEAEGLAVDWREADAEALPFGPGTFDVVASAFGAMFADAGRATAELFRVARPGATVAMANYAVEGFIGAMGELIAGYAPATPEVPSPFAWGDPEEVRRRFDGLVSSIVTVRRTLTWAFPTVDAAWAAWERSNPVQVAIGQVFPAEVAQEIRERGVGLMREENRSVGGGVRLDSAYLVVVAVKGP